MNDSTLREVIKDLNSAAVGREMLALASELFPICRSITGQGVRKTLALLQEVIPVEVHEVASGTEVFDWTVPNEWNIRGAYIRDPSGRKIVDFGSSNLHVVSYSSPVQGVFSLEELRPHLHSIPEHPDWIPYRTSYYQETWGFCLSHRQLSELKEGDYEVSIDASLEAGYLTYGELVLPGETPAEVLLSCHICHPSLCNDNLSGLVVSAFLARALGKISRKFTYRFIFIPGTIGSITWLAKNEETVHRIHAGLVLANLGDAGDFTYKRSRQNNSPIDTAVIQALVDSGLEYEIEDFVPFGYDERQYCSPGFNLPVGSLTRTPYGRYPQYHTSADDMDFIRSGALGGSLSLYLNVLAILEQDRTYLNLNPKCEPQLGRRRLYGSLGGRSDGRERELATLWVLNYSDGQHSLLGIAERSGLKFSAIAAAAQRLLGADLLEEVS